MANLSKTQLRTRENFIRAFIALYTDTPIEKINVKMLADKAGYNRSSFYLYFKDVYDLRQAAEDELINVIESSADDILSSHPKITLPEFITAFASVAAQQADLIYLYCRSEVFKGRLYQKIKPIFMKVNHVEEETVESEYIRSLIFNVIIHNINYCYTHQAEISIDEVINLTLQIIAPGMEIFFDLNNK